MLVKAKPVFGTVLDSALPNFLYYQLGQRCALSVWAITSPLWIIMVAFSLVELWKPQLVDQIYQGSGPKQWRVVYGVGIWCIWLIFTLAFGLGTVANHLLFYNVPAFLLFLAAAIMQGFIGRKRVMPA